jgi:hypothetical protein
LLRLIGRTLQDPEFRDARAAAAALAADAITDVLSSAREVDAAMSRVVGRWREGKSMIPKSVQRFSEKIMLHQRPKAG